MSKNNSSAFLILLNFAIIIVFCSFASSQRGALNNELRSYPTNLEQVMLFKDLTKN